MPKIVHITPHFAVTGALRPEQVAEVAALGFRSIVSNLPDGELVAFPASKEERALAERAGLGFRHIPSTKADIFSDRVIGGMTEALTNLEGPVLAHCASGQRSALAWAAAAANFQNADCILEVLGSAGFDFRPLREELEDLRDRSRSDAVPPALDAGCGDDGMR